MSNFIDKIVKDQENALSILESVVHSVAYRSRCSYDAICVGGRRFS